MGWCCRGVWGFEEDSVTVCITNPDFKGPKEDDEVRMAVSMDGASVTFKDTICVWQRPPPLPDDLNISGWWTLTPVEDGGDVVNFVLHHEPGSKTFSGYQKDFDAIRDGLIDGDRIEWKVDVFRIKGRLEAEGRRLTAMEVTSDLDASFFIVYEGLREEEPANGLCAVCLSDFEHG